MSNAMPDKNTVINRRHAATANSRVVVSRWQITIVDLKKCLSTQVKPSYYTESHLDDLESELDAAGKTAQWARCPLPEPVPMFAAFPQPLNSTCGQKDRVLVGFVEPWFSWANTRLG